MEFEHVKMSTITDKQQIAFRKICKCVCVCLCVCVCVCMCDTMMMRNRKLCRL